MHPYLIPGLEAGPAIYGLLFEQFSPEKLDAPTHPGRFTPREVIAHLADWEPILSDERIQAVLENPGKTIALYDEGDRSIEKNYAGTDPRTMLQAFREERTKTIEYLRSLSKEAFNVPLVHPERGDMVTGDVANMMVGHDMYHILQLHEALRN